MTLVRPLGTILPGAVATMSTVPTHAQRSAAENTAMMIAPTARPVGEGGVSVISSAAGRNASSYSSRRGACFGKAMTFLLADFIDAGLHKVKLCVTAVAAHQLVVTTVLYDSTALDRNDPIGPANRGETVRYDKHG